MPDILLGPVQEPQADPDEARLAEEQTLADPGFDPESGDRLYSRVHEDGTVMTATAKEVGKLCTAMAGQSEESIGRILESHRIGQEARARAGHENESMADKLARIKAKAAERATPAAVHEKSTPKVSTNTTPQLKTLEKPVAERTYQNEAITPEDIAPVLKIQEVEQSRQSEPFKTEAAATGRQLITPEQQRADPDTVDSLPVVEHAIWMARSAETSALKEANEIPPKMVVPAEAETTAAVEPQPTITPKLEAERPVPQAEGTEVVVSIEHVEPAASPDVLPEAPTLPPPFEIVPATADIEWSLPPSVSIEDVLVDLELETFVAEGEVAPASLAAPESEILADELLAEEAPKIEAPALATSAEVIDKPESEYEIAMQTLTERVTELEPAEAAEVHVLLGELQTIIEAILKEPTHADNATEEQLQETLTELFEYAGIDYSREAIEHMARTLMDNPEVAAPQLPPITKPDFDFAEQSMLLGTDEGLRKVLATLQQLRWQTSRAYRYLGKLGVLTSLFKLHEMGRLAAA